MKTACGGKVSKSVLPLNVLKPLYIFPYGGWGWRWIQFITSSTTLLPPPPIHATRCHGKTIYNKRKHVSQTARHNDNDGRSIQRTDQMLIFQIMIKSDLRLRAALYHRFMWQATAKTTICGMRLLLQIAIDINGANWSVVVVVSQFNGTSTPKGSYRW